MAAQQQREEHEQRRSDPHRPGEKHGRYEQAEQRRHRSGRPLLPHRQRPPRRHSEAGAHGLREEGIVREGAGEVVERQHQQHHAGHCEWDRETKPPRDQIDKASGQRRTRSNHGVENAEPVGATPGAEQHRHQVGARRVVRHLAHRAFERSVVDQMSRAFDVVNEQQVVREIRTAAGWEQRRPRDAEQPRHDRANHAGPGEQIEPTRLDTHSQRPGDRRRDRDRRRQHDSRHQAEAGRIDQVRHDRHRRQEGRDGGGDDLGDAHAALSFFLD